MRCLISNDEEGSHTKDMENLSNTYGVGDLLLGGQSTVKDASRLSFIVALGRLFGTTSTCQCVHLSVQDDVSWGIFLCCSNGAPKFGGV